MRLLSFFFGSVWLDFSESDRTQVYECLLSGKIAVTSVKQRTDGFSLFLFSSDAKRLVSELEAIGMKPIHELPFGLPVILRGLIGRSGLLVGIAIGIALLLFSRSRVWEIEISGNGSVDPDLLLEELRECGLSEGMSFHDFDGEEISFEMQKLDPRISWMQIRREGVRAIVEWIPTKEGDGAIAAPENCGANLVSSKDAVVVDIEIEYGEAVVSVGSVVRAGDLLVSGVGAHSAGYASGRVIGRVREQIQMTVPITIEEIVPTKTKRVGLCLKIFGRSFSFGETEGDIREPASVYLFGKIRLPIVWETVSRVEYTVIEREISESEAARIARRMLSERLAVLLSDGELLGSSLTGSFGSDGYTLSAEVEYLINIAKTLEFSLENE